MFDNSTYHPPGRLFEDLNNETPETLTYFVERVILKNKRLNLDHFNLICTNICHSFMSSVRPRSFESKLQLGLVVFFHRRFRSKRLILYKYFHLLVFASYNDTVVYEAAAVFHRPPYVLPPESGTLIQ